MNYYISKSIKKNKKNSAAHFSGLIWLREDLMGDERIRNEAKDKIENELNPSNCEGSWISPVLSGGKRQTLKINNKKYIKCLIEYNFG